MNWEYPLKTWGRVASLVGGIRCRKLERNRVDRDVYCLGLWI